MSETLESAEGNAQVRDLPETLDVILLEEGERLRWVQIMNWMERGSSKPVIRYNDLSTSQQAEIYINDYELTRFGVGFGDVRMCLQSEIERFRKKFGGVYDTALHEGVGATFRPISESELQNIHWASGQNVRELQMCVTVWGKFTKKVK